MQNLETHYMGLKLKNPLIIGSSRLTMEEKKVTELERQGAGAVVLKSLFEEQLTHDRSKMIEGSDFRYHTDAYDFLTKTSGRIVLDAYLESIEKMKKKISIPVIASINAVSPGSWIDYAAEIESSGADALELNIFILAADSGRKSEDIENKYLEIIRNVRNVVKIPVAVKIGVHFTGMAEVFNRFERAGADGLVLFNRFYRPDIDIERLKLVAARVTSSPDDYTVPLHWMALLSGNIGCSLCASGGIHDGSAIIKQLLAGADAVQVCSVLMKNGPEFITVMLDDVRKWMDRHAYESVNDFQGILSRKKSGHPEDYTRSQYIRALVGIQ